MNFLKRMSLFEKVLAFMFLIIFVNNVIYFTILTFHLQDLPKIPVFPDRKYITGNLEHTINERPNKSPTKIVGMPSLKEFRNLKKTGRLPVRFAKIVGD